MSIESNSSSVLSRLFVTGLAILASASGAVSARSEPFHRVGGHLDLWDHPQGRPDAGEAMFLSHSAYRTAANEYRNILQKPQSTKVREALQTVNSAAAGTPTKHHLRGF